MQIYSRNTYKRPKSTTKERPLEPTIEPEHCSLEPLEPFEPTIEPEHCSLEPLEPFVPTIEPEHCSLEPLERLREHLEILL